VPAAPFVPEDFLVPLELVTEDFRLVPLGPEHNEADHAAWSTSIEHIRQTAGMGASWPPPEGMSLDDNRADLERHARDFRERTGFTFTVLEPSGDRVLGCVYIYPDRAGGEGGAQVRSWVRADARQLDETLYDAVDAWLAQRWPFARVDYSPRRSP
jgi:hypothetical protein